MVIYLLDENGVESYKHVSSVLARDESTLYLDDGVSRSAAHML